MKFVWRPFLAAIIFEMSTCFMLSRFFCHGDTEGFKGVDDGDWLRRTKQGAKISLLLVGP